MGLANWRSYPPLAGFILIPACLFLFFQNCSGYKTSSSTIESTSTHDPLVIIAGREAPRFESLSQLELWRQRTWAAKCGPNDAWEVCFEGAEIPGYDQPSMFDWDNARDDDAWRANSRLLSWLTNLSDATAATFMRVDRSGLEFREYSGHFWRRDEFLKAASGFEATFRIRVLPQSGAHGVMLHFKDDVHQFKVHFAPDSVSFHPLIGMSSDATASVNRNNLTMNVFTVRKEAMTGRVRVWVNGAELFTTNTLTPGPVGNLSYPVSGEGGLIAPRIGFGDNNNRFENGMAGAYDVDYFYYRRQLVDPGRSGLRIPASLPVPAGCSGGTSLRDDNLGRQVDSEVTITGIPDVGNGDFRRSLEFSVRLINNGKQGRGFSFDYFDKLGGLNVTVYPDRITAKAGGKAGLSTMAIIPGFNGLDTNRIRMVRGGDGLYWHIFVNDNPVPALVDIRASGFSTEPFVHFGPFVTKAITELSPADTITSRMPTGSAAEVTSLRLCD